MPSSLPEAPNTGNLNGCVIFDYQDWAVRFGQLAAQISPQQAQAYFDEATLYLDNTPASPVRDLRKRALLLGLLVAHLAQINLPAGQGGSGMVGVVNEVQQGSIRLSATQGNLQHGQAWFCQTQAGASFWAATGFLRQMRFVPARRLYL